MYPSRLAWLLSILSIHGTFSKPIATPATVKSYHADFEDYYTSPYTGAEPLGYYGGGPGYTVGPYESPPTPYNGLKWQHFSTINGFSGYHQQYPVVRTCSGNQSIFAEVSGTGADDTTVTGMTLDYAGNNGTSFNLESCCVACFTDYDGSYKGSNSEGYPYYYDDFKRAVNCTISFTAKTATGQIKKVLAHYDLGCKKNGVNCHQSSRPMSTIAFNGLLDDAVEVRIKYERSESERHGGFCSHPDGCGPNVNGLHDLSMMFDSFKYTIKS